MTQQASKKESCAAASVYKRMETLDGFSPKEKMPCDESKSHVRLQRICSVTTDDVLTTQDAFLIIQQGVVAEQQKQYKEAIQRFILAAEILDKSVTIASNSPRIQELLRGKSMEVFQWAENLLAYLELPTETRLMTPCPVRRSSGVDISTPMEAEPAVQVAVDELTNMHYTPVTTKNPIDFTQDGYRLQCLLRGRCARLLIVVTMYNEDEFEIESTLRKIANNVAYLQAHELPGYEGEQAWQNILVCVVSDGRTKANKGALKRLSEMGLFDEDTMTIFSKGLDTQMHLFEKTVVMKRANDTIVRKRSKLPPLQVVFALKEHNAGKLNSHLWFFKAFCEQVNPKYSVLLDVGTMPTKAAFYKLLATMEVNRQVGGVCGEIAVSRPLPNLWSLVIATQHYEYKISNILDKATESCFGFISVLPGAFSAYRYKAIQGAPLDAYFKSLTTSMQELGPFQGNMYLAEDRILCFELLAREGANWTMTYVKDAIARTDVPTTLVDLIVQRRRWLNGSFFAMLYTLFNWGRIYSESNHGLLRSVSLMIQYIFLLLQIVFNWFLVGNFYLTVYYVIFYSLQENTLGVLDTRRFYDKYGRTAEFVFASIYILVFVVQIVLGMGNKPKHVSWTYRTISWYYMILVIVTMTVSALTLIESGNVALNPENIALGTAIFGVYFIAAALHCELHHVLLSFLQYSLMLPVMINTLNIFSFCNLQDLSWGTKGIETNLDTAGSDDGYNKGEYKDVLARQKAAEARATKEADIADTVRRHFDSFRSNLLLVWICSNAALVITWTYFDSIDKYLLGLFIGIGCFNTYRLLGSICFLIYTGRQYLLLKCCLCCGCLKRNHDRETAQIMATVDSV